MAKRYQHLDQLKRDRLEALRHAGHTQKTIAAILDMGQSTVSRELSRNRRAGPPGAYQATVAQHKAYLRRYYAKWRWKKINHDPLLEAYVVTRLMVGWNPDEIAGRMKRDRRAFYASKTAIYEWLRSARGVRYCPYLYSQRHTVRHRTGPKAKRVLIPNRVGIAHRPAGATHRTRYGHWEADTVVSGKRTTSTAALSVIWERKARFIDVRVIPNLKPAVHAQAVRRMLAHKKALSMSQDNGIENRGHLAMGVTTYFCDPYSAWQKGGVEQGVKLLRRYIPKGSNISQCSAKYVSMVVQRLNEKPRKVLGYQTPSEVMRKHHLLIPNQEYALRG